MKALLIIFAAVVITVIALTAVSVILWSGGSHPSRRPVQREGHRAPVPTSIPSSRGSMKSGSAGPEAANRRTKLQTFVADVEFRFSADSVEAGGSRLRELAAAASRVGFEMKRGRVEPDPAIPDPDADGWTQYGADTP